MIGASLVLATLLVAVTAATETEDIRTTRGRFKHPDPFSLLDRHMSVAMTHDHMLPHLATPYFWPWAELAKAALTIEEDEIEEPVVRTDSDKYEVKLDVHNFQPKDIKVKVRSKTLLVEGKKLISDEKTDKSYLANHFIQRYMLPPGVEPEEITAVFKITGVLHISAPMHPVKPPVKERDVPLIIEEASVREYIKPIDEKKDKELTEIKETKAAEESITVESEPIKKIETEDQPSDQMRFKHLVIRESIDETSSTKEELTTEGHTLVPEVPEATVLVIGKTRKKELNNITTDQKKNETKTTGDNNELDYVVE